MKRDLVGYGEHPPRVPWPNDAKVAVSVVLNYEEGAESSIALGDPVDEDISVFGGWSSPPDRRSMMKESFFEYGARAGVWRLLGILREFDVPSTVFACGMALERNPDVASAFIRDGHEVGCHGYRWRGTVGLSEEAERAEIKRSIASIEETTGVRPVGWYVRDGITERTRDILVEEGLIYDSNAYSDDLPYYVPTAGGHHLVLPYAGDTNDARFWGQGSLSTADDFTAVLSDTLEMLLIEGATVPKLMSVGIHTRIGGRPGIAIALRRFIEYAQAQQDVWFATRADIARWWLANGPAPATPPEAVTETAARR
ncbi:polysaccharide deacetylase family protein [Streptomyces sp. NPDC056821]|uniref:polysaccharide deacetylase family protein n=1 Tax=unclassified Streptomyces TaxID=2593676 RepID=UPI0036B267DF